MNKLKFTYEQKKWIKDNSKQRLSNKENDMSIIGNFMWHTNELLEILQK